MGGLVWGREIGIRRRWKGRMRGIIGEGNYARWYG